MKKMVFRDKRGFFLVLVAALMLTACVFAGFTIDLGSAYMVKAELQHAADATALAGAGALYKNSTLRFDLALAEANGFIGKNRAGGKVLTSCQVERGFWNMSTATAEPLGSGSTSTGTCYDSGNSCSNDYPDCGANDGCRQFKFPYVKVTVIKSAAKDGEPAQNDGPVLTSFARMIGWNGFEPRASAMAISASPGWVPSGVLFPFVIMQLHKNNFLGVPVGQKLNESGVGEWSDLSAGSSIKANDVRGYIDYLAGTGEDKKASPELSVYKDQLHVETVNPNTSPYTAARNFIEARKAEGKKALVLMPVVSKVNLDTVVVKGFVVVELLESDPTSKILNGRLLDEFAEYDLPPGATPGGESTNTVIHPKLVH